MDLGNKEQRHAGTVRQQIFRPTMFGRYCLVDQISKGGMSDIYLAKIVGAEGFQKPLVIKKLLPHCAAQSNLVKRFLNEAKTLSQMNHSNLVQILDMGIIDGEYYIALEYIEGRNVAHIISKAAKIGRPASLGFVLHVATQLGHGLAYAHRKKGESGENLMLVHQDINSFNVMVSYEAEVKIIDFGIAEIFLDKQNTVGLPVVGKLLYFSPEQLQRKPVDRRVDIYGTGVLMYEMLTGERLVDHHETVQDTVKAILEMDVRAKVHSNGKIRDELKPVLIKAMAFSREDRYSWMEEMLLDIRTVINKCRLDLDPTEFSAYMKELFQREILLDRRRMRKLMSEKLPASSETEAKRTEPARPGRSPGERGDLGQNLRPSSWRLQELGEYASAQGNLEPRILRFSVGKSIFSQGDPGTEIYVIQKGKVRIVLHAGKIEQTLAILSEGDFFGESALVDDFQRSVSALAEEDCELICLEREVFATLINHELARKIVFNLIQKLRDSRELVEGTLLQDDLSRLIFGLMSLQRRASAENGKEIDLGELKALFRLDNDDQIKKYLAKLESLDIVQGDEKVVQVKKVDTLRNILTVLCGEGKCGFKL